MSVLNVDDNHEEKVNLDKGVRPLIRNTDRKYDNFTLNFNFFFFGFPRKKLNIIYAPNKVIS